MNYRINELKGKAYLNALKQSVALANTVFNTNFTTKDKNSLETLMNACNVWFDGDGYLLDEECKGR